MSQMTVDEKKLRYMEYIHRETGERHHTNEEDMRQYEMLRAGDPGTVAEADRMFASGLAGHVSDDPVRNCKYLFVAHVLLVGVVPLPGLPVDVLHVPQLFLVYRHRTHVHSPDLQ